MEAVEDQHSRQDSSPAQLCLSSWVMTRSDPFTTNRPPYQHLLVLIQQVAYMM